MNKTYILNKDLSVPNEVVLRQTKDDRREIKKAKNANDIIYLGTKTNFTKNISSFISESIVNELYLKFEKIKENGNAMQRGDGIKVKHIIYLKNLEKLIPKIDEYFNFFKILYRNPNFDKEKVRNQLQEYLKKSNTLIFYSDLVFISDNPPKPYFKWFRDLNGEENLRFDFIKEFLIPKLTNWNFQVSAFHNNELEVIWKVSNSNLLNILKDVNLKKRYKSIEKFLINEVLANVSDINVTDIATFKDAIIKARIGQSKFRNNLLKSTRKSCIFTGIEKPEILLIASHIKPWKDSNNTERLDVNNGILLTPTFDKLFDKFQISFDTSGKVMFSSKIDEDTWTYLFPKFNDIKHIKIEINDNNTEYLKFHRSKFNE